MVAAVAACDVNDPRVGLLSTVVAAINVETRAVQMHQPRAKPQALGGGGRDEAVKCRDPRVIERIQGAPQRSVVEMLGLNPRGAEPGRRCIVVGSQSPSR
jgi:hypothetical protein